MISKSQKFPDGKEVLVPFDGKPVWMAKKDKHLMFYPILDQIKEADIIKMCLEIDEDKNTGDRTFSFQKIDKDEFCKFFGVRFDCQHDFIIMRLFTKMSEEEFVEFKMPENDEDHVKVCLLKLSPSSIKPLSINLNNRPKEIN